MGLIGVSGRREKGGFQTHLGTRCKNMVMREKRKIDEVRGAGCFCQQAPNDSALARAGIRCRSAWKERKMMMMRRASVAFA